MTKKSETPSPVTSWSLSAVAMYDECPQRFLWDRVEHRAPEESRGPALVKGDRVHKEAELFVRLRKPRGKLPESLKLYETEFRNIVKLGAVPEGSWAFNRQWDEVDWRSNDAWVRVKLNAHVVTPQLISVIDYKTGQVRSQKANTYRENLSLYALAALLKFTTARRVTAALWFLDHHVTVDDTYPRSKTRDLMELWERRVAPLLADRRFKPTPGEHCSYCPFSRSRGGECRY